MHKIVDFARDELGVKLYPGQAMALSSYYESGLSNWLLLAGRRGGKSLLADIIACYEAMVKDFTSDLREGEERYILIVSVRIENSGLHIRNIGKLLRHSKGLARQIKRETVDRIELTNGVVIQSMPASARAGRGFTCSTLILDELAFFVDSAGNSSADAIYTALEPTTATFGGRGKIIITTSVNSRVGIVYDLFQAAEAGENDFYLTKVASRELNPKVSERQINSAMKRDPESAQAEYFSEWRDPVENYLSVEAIEGAINPGALQTVKADPSRTYVMAIDPATMGDRYALIVMHREGQLYVLDYAEALKPPVNPEAAEALLFDLARRFSPVLIRVDTASTYQRVRERLPAMEYTPFSRPFKLAIYGALKEALNLGQVVLYPDAELVDELKALQIRNGADISAPKAGKVKHDDLADCLALCVEALASGVYSSDIGWFPDPWNSDTETVKEWELEAGRPWGSDTPGVNHKPHRPGVTWRNCPHRVSGCLACIEELRAEGEYNRPLPDGIIESDLPERQAEREYWAVRQAEAFQAEREGIRKFWMRVRGGLNNVKH